MGLISKLFSKEKKTKEVKARDPFTIQVGDIVEYDLEDYETVGKIAYRQGKYEWFSYQLTGSNKSIWLSASMDAEVELGIYKPIKLPRARDIPNELTYENETYYFIEKGEALVTGEGRSENLTGQTVTYAEYAKEDDSSFLSIEIWGSEVEVSIGYPIKPFEIKIIAGSN